MKDLNNMNNINEKELNEVLENISHTDKVKEIYDYLYILIVNLSNTQTKYKPKSIINEFLTELEKTKNFKPKKQRLIKLILDLKIKDLFVVEKIYSLFDYPFPYQEKVLSDLYDEALRLFIEENLYSEQLEDTYLKMPINTDNIKQTNHDKYKICVLYFIRSYIEQHKTKNKFEQFINKLFLEIYFSKKYDDIEERIFSKSDYYASIEELYTNYIDEHTSLKEKVEFDQFKYIMLFIVMYSKLNKKTEPTFRKIFSLMDHSYVMQVLTETFLSDKYFSYNIIQTIYKNLFKNEANKTLLNNYLNDVVYNIEELIFNN